MAHDIFISYSSHDKPTADAACAVLESKGMRCWVAPRDILPGSDWGESIVSAINASKAMVLIFSSHANNSQQIKREVERAVHRGIPIIPVRIEEVLPASSLEYFLSTPHWLDAFVPPLERHLERLAKSLRLLVADPQEASEESQDDRHQGQKTVTCPQCGTKLKVATTSLGKKIKCTNCSTAFLAKMNIEFDQQEALRDKSKASKGPRPTTTNARVKEGGPKPDFPSRKTLNVLVILGLLLFAGGIGAVLGGIDIAGAVGLNVNAKLVSKSKEPGPKSSDKTKTNANNKIGDGKKSKEKEKEATLQQVERSSRSERHNNLRAIAFGIHRYFDALNRLPGSAIYDPDGTPLLSWRVAILPYIDELPLYKDFDLTKPWDDPHNKKLMARMPKVFAPPRDFEHPAGMTYCRALAGPGTVLESLKAVDGKLQGRSLLSLSDGTSNCIMIVESSQPIEWTRPVDLPLDPSGPLPKLGLTSAGFIAVFADASVRFIPANVPEDDLRPYFTCNNGMTRSPLSSDKP